MDVLQNIEESSTILFFTGLIFDIVIVVFIGLSVMLMNSLMNLNLQHKQFEMTVTRVLGLS